MSEKISSTDAEDKDKIIPLTPEERQFTVGVRQRDENFLQFLAGLGGLGKDQEAITPYELGILDRDAGHYGDSITTMLAGDDAVNARVIVDVAYDLGTPTEEEWARTRVAAQVEEAQMQIRLQGVH